MRHVDLEQRIEALGWNPVPPEDMRDVLPRPSMHQAETGDPGAFDRATFARRRNPVDVPSGESYAFFVAVTHESKVR